MIQLDTKKTSKNINNFYCEVCDFKCIKKGDWSRHIARPKHIFNEERIQTNTKKTSKTSKHTQYVCECGKMYIYHSGLYKHKKNCVYINPKIEPSLNDLQSHEKQHELIEYLLKENSEFKQMMMDQNKNMIELSKISCNTTISNNTTNNNNFNLNVFLNETCKNAMNIMDFVNQLQINVNDLEETGQIGFSEGISRIFINGLKQINIPDRPIHCSDLKRETIYIKDKNQWNKETEDKCLLTNAIKHVAHKNLKQISEWTKENPEYNDSDSRQNDKYLKIVSNSMNGSTIEETNKNYNKIIKNIVKETIIDK
jgi:hypothetical protein